MIINNYTEMAMKRFKASREAGVSKTCSPAQIEAMRALRAAGKNFTEISNELGVAHQTVRRYTKGIEPRQKRVFTPAEIQAAFSRWAR